MSAEVVSAADVGTSRVSRRARLGDWLEVHGPPGKPSRRGQVLEVIGQGRHVRYRVRWDEKHQSIFYPADGVTVLKPAKRPRGRRSDGI